MTALYPICCLLTILGSLLLAGFVIFESNQQEDFLCCQDGSSDWGISWAGDALGNVFSWDRLLSFIGLGAGSLCDEENSSFWKYFRKPRFRLEDDELLLMSYCTLHDYAVDKIRSMTPKPQGNNQVIEWVTRLDLGKTVSEWTGYLMALDFAQMWTTANELAMIVIGQCKMGAEYLGMKFELGVVDVVKNILLAYIIWRGSGLIYHKQGWFFKRQRARKPQMNHVPKELIKLLTFRYFPIEILKICLNFHTFHLESKSTGRPVFMRCLRSQATKTAKLGLAKEERILKSMKHRNIIRVMDWITGGPAGCLGLEFAKNGTLQQALSNHVGEFRLVERISVFRQVVRAVAYLHRAGMAHLNIRCKSVAVFQTWWLVKLAGFTRVTKVTRRGLSNRFDMHPSCVPAEVMARRELYDPYKVDSWALGMLFLFLLTGDAHACDITQTDHTIPSLEECDDKKRKALQDLVSGLLSDEPRRRPNAASILTQLEKLEK